MYKFKRQEGGIIAKLSPETLMNIQNGLTYSPKQPTFKDLKPTTIKEPKGLSNLINKTKALGSSTGGSIASTALGAFNSIAGNNNVEKTGKTAEIAGTLSGLVEGVSSKINPLGSSVASAGKMIGKLIGGNKDRVEGTGSAVVGAVSQGLSYLGPWGMVAGAALNMINGIGGKRVDSFTDLSGDFSSDFSGSAFDVNDIHSKYSNKKAGLFDFGFASKGNKAVDEAVRQQNIIMDTQDLNRKRKNNNIGGDLTSSILDRYQGNQQLRLAKKGIKFPELENARNILSNINHKEVQTFKSGGKLEKENIIPTGALHKNLHHIEENAPELYGNITHKGIPVGTYEDGGEFSQTAEIEAGEIIFSLDVTKQLEQYHSDKSDESAIECGKYLVDQIFNNTRDDNKVIKKTE